MKANFSMKYINKTLSHIHIIYLIQTIYIQQVIRILKTADSIPNIIIYSLKSVIIIIFYTQCWLIFIYIYFVYSILSLMATLQPPQAIDLFPFTVYDWLTLKEKETSSSIHNAVVETIQQGSKDW